MLSAGLEASLLCNDGAVWTGSLGEDETEVSVNEPELWLLNDPRALQRNMAF